MSKSIYFAGELFNHKDLMGNLLLAEMIRQVSEEEFLPQLPQDLELEGKRAEAIRNIDIKELIKSDCALFNFDGTDLDSGTVVEFMIAKFLDIPSVILRTDFRNAGDQEAGCDKWNLMCSFYPRTETVTINAMAAYHLVQSTEGDMLENYYGPIAVRIVEKMQEVYEMPPLATKNPLPIDFLIP